MNQLDFEGRCAVVTGGAAGIGLAVGRRLAQSGARVALWDRDAQALARGASCTPATRFQTTASPLSAVPAPALHSHAVWRAW